MLIGNTYVDHWQILKINQTMIKVEAVIPATQRISQSSGLTSCVSSSKRCVKSLVPTKGTQGNQSSHSAKNDQRRNATLQFSGAGGNDEAHLGSGPRYLDRRSPS